MTKKQAFVAASVAGLLAAAGVARPASAEQMAAGGDKVPCYGINKCQGTGDCGGKGHACAGKNACQGKGSINLSKEDCMRIQGGSLTPPAEG